jgi:hypothetical protein
MGPRTRVAPCCALGRILAASRCSWPSSQERRGKETSASRMQSTGSKISWWGEAEGPRLIRHSDGCTPKVLRRTPCLSLSSSQFPGCARCVLQGSTPLSAIPPCPCLVPEADMTVADNGSAACPALLGCPSLRRGRSMVADRTAIRAQGRCWLQGALRAQRPVVSMHGCH